MKIFPLLALSFSALLPMTLQARVPAQAEENREERMEWWRDAKFGMFVHYGLYSGLAGEIGGKKIDGCVEWIQQYTGTETDQYFAEALPKFTYKKGNATEWVKLAEEAGCGYIVMTTRHHEGFNLYDTTGISALNSVEKNNVDIVKEFSDATKQYGLKTGYYFSVIDWNHPDYDPTGTAISYPQGNIIAQQEGRRQFGNHERFKKHLHELFERLVSQYPTDIVWWDFSSIPFQGDKAWGATDLMNTLFKHHPMAIQNNRLYCIGQSMKADEFRPTPIHMGDFTTPEHYIPAQGVNGDWEVCNTLNGTWGYSANNQKWRTGETVTRELIDIVSRGGNYLLNIGPKPDGSIPQASIDIFKTIGSWLKPNAEAIYGTDATPFATELKWGRVTRKGEDTLYLIVYDKPESGTISLPCTVSDETIITPLLADHGKVSWKNDSTGLLIDVKEMKFDKIATVIKLKGSYTKRP